MSGHAGREHQLCLIGRVAQRLGCLPKKFTDTRVFYPMALRPIDDESEYSYSDDIKYISDLRPPTPQPDEPKPQMIPYATTYQYKSPQLSKCPEKTLVAQTVSLSPMPLPAVKALSDSTPATTCVTLNPETHSTGQISHTPYLAPPSVTSQTPCQNMVPDSILQELGNVAPTQYTWNTPYGVLAYTPAPTSTLLPNPLADHSPYSPHMVDVGGGNYGSTCSGLIPSPISSDTSDSSSYSFGYSNRSGVVLNPFLASNCFRPRETPVEWNVSEPVEMVRHVLGNTSLIAIAHEPATNPPTARLHIELCFIDQPGVKWNWAPIVIRKRRQIRIADVFHSIHDYFNEQLTHAEYDLIKSHGIPEAIVVEDSWRERINSHQEREAQSAVYHGGLKRVDCLGSSKKFAGLWVDGSQLKLGLRS